MIVPLLGVLTQVIVCHIQEAKPDRKQETEAPGRYHAPDDPGGHAEYQGNRAGGPIIAQVIAGANAPNQGHGPDQHDEKPLAAGVTQQLLFFGGWFRGVWRHSTVLLSV